MPNKCVRERLLSIVDDMEMISKELFESMLTPKPQRQQCGYILEHSEIANLLVLKDKELKKCLKEAKEQECIQQKMNEIRAEVQKQDEEIKQLQKHLKEAEHILATAIYQAKQKLSAIKKANEHQISSEELIRYSHKISASHAVAAPYNWEQGDPRRPYPTDIEMRMGFIGQMNDHNLASSIHQQQQQQQQQQNAYSSQQLEVQRPSSTASNSSNSSFAWQGDTKPNLGGIQGNMQHPSAIDVKTPSKENVEDVEVMSTDSSSSSSSDSQ
ncbi:mediator of RNA polymerase II transcription subunit 4-like protein [Dinothrombium tinctorium]|uniref:Mediator of RNA polymerase II transcription subunit 4 n=1 Tax=Dinothrombium tinctorium TaxID=1965070 RepID=A0A443R6I4_9ACAR|nr:mediator of RNA polymerase II transcription subunit 4-like protein [Dinothrombium tinctorium]